MAKDVITRFKLETTGFDSKIKQAAKDLSAYSKTATQAKEGFNQFTKSNIDAAKALGTMATSTTNAKDRAKELVGAFNDAAKAYNSLTKEQQQSDWAKALAGSLTQLQQRIKETKAEMQGLGDSMKGGGGGIFSGLGNKMEGALAVFGGNLMTKAAGAVAQLGSEMADMVKQGVEMAKAGEGVRIAFERLGNGQILEGLREATHGTVTDLELMKAAVKFNDFKLPVEELGTMLAFAQQKAKDTGQSVDYMVDSIVTGLGRKSLMILDNLGLSAAEIKDKMKDTGDMTKAVGAIIREQMEKAGDYVETAADRAAQANVTLQNKMEELGRKFGPVEEASNQLWTSMKIGILDIIGGPLATLLNSLTEAGRLKNALNGINGDGSGGKQTKVQQQLSALKGSNFKEIKYNSDLERYNRQIMKADELLKKYYHTRNANTVLPNASKIFGQKFNSVNELETFQKALMTMRNEYMQGAKEIMKPVEANVKTDKAEQNVASLKKKLKELKAERKKAVKAGDQELVDILSKQINETKTNLGYLDPSSVKTTGGKTKQQQAEEKVSAALLDYQQTIDVANLELKSGSATEADVKKKQLSAQERLYDAYGDAYALYKDPKYKDAQDKAAEEIVKLGGEVKAATEAQEAARKAARELESAQKKLAEAAAKAVNAELNNDLKGFYQANKAIVANGGKPMQTPIDITYTDSNLQAFIENLKERLSKSDVGSDLYNALTKQLADANMLGNFISLAVKNGIDVAQIDPQTLFSKIFGDGQTAGDFIPDDFWKGFVEQFKEKLGNGLNLNTNTGDVSERKDERDGNRFMKKNDEGKYEAKMTDIMSGMAGGINNVVSGLNTLGVEIPAGLQSVLGGMQAVSSILSGIAVTVMAIEAIAGADAIIPFANGGIVPAFAQGGLIGRAAGGLMIPGNSMSGDRLRLPVDGGLGMIGVNSGELILNRAQQGNLASQLEGGVAASANTQPFINGEMIYLGLQAYMRRSGLGEIVTSER